MTHFTVPEKKRFRVIIDTDAKNEADDQYAIVHACLTPKLMIKGIVATHFGERHIFELGKEKTSMEASYEECVKLLELMDKTGEIPVYRGAQKAMKSPEEYEYSEGSAFLVEEAMKESENPLFVIALGAITNVACALQAHPEIADRFTLIWIGGAKYPEGGWEANLSKDVLAANVIMKSGVRLWQVPNNVYSRMLTSLTELEEKVYPYGRIGRYLFEQMVEFNDKLGDLAGIRNGEWSGWPLGESWSLGDSPTVGLLLDPHEYAAEDREAPFIREDMTYEFDGNGRQIRVYNDINSRFILEDMFSKLKKNYPANV